MYEGTQKMYKVLRSVCLRISVEENVLMEVNCKSIGPLTARPGLIVLTDLNLFFVPINDAVS